MMGAGIGVMHYTGMAAIRTQAEIALLTEYVRNFHCGRGGFGRYCLSCTETLAASDCEVGTAHYC